MSHSGGAVSLACPILGYLFPGLPHPGVSFPFNIPSRGDFSLLHPILGFLLPSLPHSGVPSPFPAQTHFRTDPLPNSKTLLWGRGQGEVYTLGLTLISSWRLSKAGHAWFCWLQSDLCHCSFLCAAPYLAGIFITLKPFKATCALWVPPLAEAPQSRRLFPPVLFQTAGCCHHWSCPSLAPTPAPVTSQFSLSTQC